MWVKEQRLELDMEQQTGQNWERSMSRLYMHLNLLISFHLQDNQITYDVGIFTLFNCDIWLRKLYRRAAQPPLRTTLEEDLGFEARNANFILGLTSASHSIF